MPNHRPNSIRVGTLTAVLIALLSLLILLPAPLHAQKKKAAPAPEVKPGDQRVTAYFDISKIVWPNPPAIARIRFLDLYTGEKIDRSKFESKKKKQTWMDRLAGAQSTGQIKITSLPFQLIRTFGVGADSKGRIYAADQAVGGIFVFNPENKDQVELIGKDQHVHFDMLAGLAVDDNDRLFVTDVKARHVLVINPKHETEGVFGSDVLVRPGGVAIDRENRFLYVVDSGDDVVDVFDADSFKLLRQIGKPSKKHEQTDPGTFSLPECVAVDADGNVYVTDTFNNRIEIFDADGQFISQFGKNGDGPADLERPKGIAIDSDGHIWVVDAATNQVKVFNKEGRLLIYFGGQGSYPGQFMGPWGIAIDKFNRVIVSETFPGRVQMFRYVTDAEAEAEKNKRASTDQKPSASSAQQASATAAATKDVAPK
ncbi:MAG: 6-bladed beta-propeller [Candidatus Sulfotelmatobacter sp.]